MTDVTSWEFPLGEQTYGGCPIKGLIKMIRELAKQKIINFQFC